MGDVDCDNFTPELVAQFGRDVAECELISLDLEMSGITFPSDQQSGADSVPLRYQNLKSVVSSFGIIQVGIALFVGGIAKVYNFYVFPRPVTEGSVNSIPLVTLCSASINFNRQHGMDFGRWISRGITWVNAKTEAELKTPSASWDKFFAGYSMEPCNTEEYLQQESAIMESIQEFIEDSSVATMRVPFVHGGQKLVKLLLYRVHQQFPNLRLIEEVSGGGSCRSLSKKSESEILFDYTGFRQIWNLITHTNKPLVLHNGMLDLLFCFQAFEADLPAEIDSFKRSVRELFPGGIYDTRLIALESGTVPSGGAALETLIDVLKSDTAAAVQIVNSGKYSDAIGQVHEAGYDALITGQVFKALQARIGDMQPWRNCVCVNRCLWTLSIDTLDTDRLVVENGKNRLVHALSDIKGTTREVIAAFDELGATVNIQWINDTAGIVIVTWATTTQTTNAAVNAKILEIVRNSNALGDKVKISSANEYIKRQIDDINEETANMLISKRFRM